MSADTVKVVRPIPHVVSQHDGILVEIVGNNFSQSMPHVFVVSYIFTNEIIDAFDKESDAETCAAIHRRIHMESLK